MRGELWTVATGVNASKPRPALIIQDDAYENLASVTVLLLTSTPLDAPLLRAPIEPSPVNGLLERSWVMIDKITTVSRLHCGRRIGTLSPGEVTGIERLLAVFLGLAR